MTPLIASPPLVGVSTGADMLPLVLQRGIEGLLQFDFPASAQGHLLRANSASEHVVRRHDHGYGYARRRIDIHDVLSSRTGRSQFPAKVV
jgi:hypothetical protein